MRFLLSDAWVNRLLILFLAIALLVGAFVINDKTAAVERKIEASALAGCSTRGNMLRREANATSETLKFTLLLAAKAWHATYLRTHQRSAESTSLNFTRRAATLHIVPIPVCSKVIYVP
jgi:hypothetical protein